MKKNVNGLLIVIGIVAQRPQARPDGGTLISVKVAVNIKGDLGTGFINSLIEGSSEEYLQEWAKASVTVIEYIEAVGYGEVGNKLHALCAEGTKIAFQAKADSEAPFMIDEFVVLNKTQGQ